MIHREAKASFITRAGYLSFIYTPFCSKGFYFRAGSGSSILFPQIRCLHLSSYFFFFHDCHDSIINNKRELILFLAVGVSKTYKHTLRLDLCYIHSCGQSAPEACLLLIIILLTKPKPVLALMRTQILE